MGTPTVQFHPVSGRAAGLPVAPRGRPVKPGAADLAVPLRNLLFNSALLAASRGLDDEAARIRPVLLGLGVDARKLGLAFAIVLLRRGDADGCLAALESDVLPRDPGHELGLALQAGAWRLKGRPQWRAQADALLAASADPLVRSVVQSWHRSESTTV